MVILIWTVIVAGPIQPACSLERSDWEEEGLIGPVQSVQTTESFVVQTDRFDLEGRLVARIQGGEDTAQGSWPLHFRYRYDQAERRVAEEVRDARGALVKETRFAYNASGDRSAEVAVWNDGTFENASLYEYDANHHQILGIHYNAHQIINRNSYLFNDTGRLIRERFERNYEYDVENGSVMKSDHFDRGYEVTLRYDDRGLIREKIVANLIGQIQGRSEFAYNDHGNQIEERIFNAEGRPTDRKTYLYAYDAVGNWVMETFQWWKLNEGGETLQQSHIRERSFAYFETR
jgi:hypothetical protein